MWLFRKHKRKAAAKLEISASDKVALRIVGLTTKMQRGFANKMDKLFRDMPVKRIRIALVLFCLICGGYSLYLIGNAIAGKPDKQSEYKVGQIDRPMHFDKTGSEVMVTENGVDEETFQKIQQFKVYMDSLKSKNSFAYDSILSLRPLLMDSVLVLEQIYYSQKQNQVYEK